MARPDIVGAINAYNTYNATDLVQAFNGSIGQAAAALAGVHYGKGVSKDKAYLAERRSLERQLKGQFKRPSAAKQAKYNKAGRAQAKGQVGVTLEGTIAVNGQGDAYERDRTIDRVYSQAEWDEISELAAQGDAQGIYDYIATSYGVDFIDVVDGDVLIGED